MRKQNDLRSNTKKETSAYVECINKRAYFEYDLIVQYDFFVAVQNEKCFAHGVIVNDTARKHDIFSCLEKIEQFVETCGFGGNTIFFVMNPSVFWQP